LAEEHISNSEWEGFEEVPNDGEEDEDNEEELIGEEHISAVDRKLAAWGYRQE